MSNNPYLDRLRALDKIGAHADPALKGSTCLKECFEGFEGDGGRPVSGIEGPEVRDAGSSHALAVMDGFESFEGGAGMAFMKIEDPQMGSENENGHIGDTFKTLETPAAHNLYELSQDRENQKVSASVTLKALKTAGDVRLASLRPTAAQGRRWAEVADRIVGELGRHQRGDFSRRKWQQTLAGVRRFVEGGWAHRAWRLGWGLLELFGVDRKAPWARRDRRGLALILDDSKVTALTEHDATIETPTGAHLNYTRRRIEFLEIVLVDQIAPAYRLGTIRPEWADVLERVDRCRSLDADVSETRWRQYRADLGRLADENWDYPPSFFMGWNGRGSFPVSAKRALAWVIDGGTITNLTRDTAICGNVVFRRLGGDQGWQRGVGPHLDQGRGKVANWLLD